MIMNDFIDFTFHFWNDFSAWNPPEIALYTILCFSILSAWIITRFVMASPLFVGPISFIALTFGAMLANFVARSQVLMGTNDLQKALLFTVAGHAVAAIILLATFKVGHKSFAK
jgi:hypothetical protein